MRRERLSTWGWFGLLMIAQVAAAQPPDTLWTRTYGGPNTDQCNHIEAALDGGWILAGFSGSDCWVIRTDSSGDSLWSCTFGGSGPAVALFATETVNSDILVFAIGCLDNARCGTWLVRLDSDGSILDSELLSNGVAETVRRTADNGFIVAGSIYAQGDDFWLMKTDSAGTVEWSSTLGAPADQEANSVCQTDDGGYVLGGQLQQSIARLERVAASGDSVWVRNYPVNGVASCRAITETEDSGFVFAGHTDPVISGSADFLLMKVSAQGDSVWSRTYGAAVDEYGYDMIRTNDQGYLLAGVRAAPIDSAWVVKTDSAGNLLWSQVYGYGMDASFQTVVQTADGGYLLGGQNGGDVWLVRLAPERTPPHDLTIYRVGDDIVLRWAEDASPFYRIYSGTSPNGAMDNLEGSTSLPMFTVPGGIGDTPRFFVVVGWDGN